MYIYIYIIPSYPHHQYVIQKCPRQALLSADVGFEATVPEKLHATFVFHGELLQALTKTQLAARPRWGGKMGWEPQAYEPFVHSNPLDALAKRWKMMENDGKKLKMMGKDRKND